MQSNEKPYVLYVAEIIYLKIFDVKKHNPHFSNIDAVDNFIGSKKYKEISSGKFHNDWLKKLEDDNFFDKKLKKKIPEETIKLLNIQKNQINII